MTFELNKQIADDLMKIKGEVRGVVFKTDEKFILKNGGEKKLKEIEEEIKTLGYSLEYGKINDLDFSPIGLRVLSLLAIANAFGMDEGQVKEMGSFAPKVSFFIKFFIQHFFSVKKTLSQAPTIWRKHYTIGKLVVAETDEDKRRIVIRLEDFNIHPIFCHYLAGYFLKLCEITTKSPGKVSETKCSLKNDPCHEFTITWQK